MRETLDIGVSARAPVAVTLLVLVTAAMAGACIDIDDASDALEIRAPTGVRAALEMALQGYDGALAGNPPRILYDSTERNARAVTGDDSRTVILITDHPAWATYVEDRATVVERRAVARDSLVVVVAGGRPAGDLAALAGPEFERVATTSTEAAAAGMYAREALLRYGLWSDVSGRLQRVDDAGQALARVADARADAAIVLASDARDAGVEPSFRVDPAYHQPAWIEVLLLVDEPRSRALFAFLSEGQAVAAFQARGFETEPASQSGTP